MQAEDIENSSSLSKRLRVFLLIATVIIIVITILLMLKKPPEITQTALDQEVQSIQQKLPIRVDEYTELKSVELNNMNIEYLFMVASDPTQTSVFNVADENFAQRVETTVKNSACINENTRLYINSGVSLSYRYIDADNNSIASFEIPTGFCNK